MKTLTKIQKETLNFIQNFILKNGYAPSIHEIMKKFNLKSQSSAWGRINWLCKKGYLTKKKDIARSIVIVNDVEKDIIEFVKNFNPRIFNHRERYRNLIDILKKYQNQIIKNNEKK